MHAGIMAGVNDIFSRRKRRPARCWHYLFQTKHYFAAASDNIVVMKRHINGVSA